MSTVKIGVVGSGTMGNGIAQTFASCMAVPTTMVDLGRGVARARQLGASSRRASERFVKKEKPRPEAQADEIHWAGSTGHDGRWAALRERL